MKLLYIFFICNIFVKLILAYPQLSGRIIGGSPVNISELPYQISLQLYSQHICGGSIIHHLFILTAAHCVDGVVLDKLSVVAGTSSYYSGGIRVKVCSITIHNKYDAEEVDYDISILKLCKKITFGSTIMPIALPRYNENYDVGMMAMVSGWGYDKEHGSLTKKLQKVLIPIVNFKICQKLYYYDGYVTSRMLCAGYISGQYDACQGDSGGPLVAMGKLIGIVSWGYGCARPNYPGIYTRVSTFRIWIQLKTGL